MEGVEKSLLLLMLTQPALQTHISTIGIDFKIIHMRIHNEAAAISVWDTQSFNGTGGISSAYIRNSQLFVLVFDLYNVDTLNFLDNSMQQIIREGPENPVIIYVGLTKEGQERVVEDQGMRVATANRASYIEVDIGSVEQVHELFLLVERLMNGESPKPQNGSPVMNAIRDLAHPKFIDSFKRFADRHF